MLLRASCASKVKGSSSASEQNMVLETKAGMSEGMDDAARDKTIYSMRWSLGHRVMQRDSAALIFPK